MDAAPPTVTGLLLAPAGREQPGLFFEDRRWSWREHVGECAPARDPAPEMDRFDARAFGSM
jgi:hypothetical protein